MKQIFSTFLIFGFLLVANIASSQINCENYITSYTITQDVCNPRLVHFKNLNPGEEIFWDFDDGTTGNKNEVSHEYKNEGEYVVYMRVRYLGNCIGEVTKRIPVYLAEDKQLIATPNTTICPGNSVSLETKNIPADYAICWLPVDGLSDPQSRNPVAQPKTTTTYRYQTRYVGENLVKNSGFENGYANFYSSYDITEYQHKYEGAYWVTNNPNLLNADFSTCGDHTTGKGNMMVVNGSYKPGEIVWSQKIDNIEPNTVYSFGVWIQSVNHPHPSKLLFRINGKILGDNVNAGDNPCEWSEFSTLWNSEGATSALIEIINNNIIQGGNDFALDDITFFTQSIKYDEVTITVAPDPVVKASDDVAVCAGTSVTLNASGASTYSWTPADGLSNAATADPKATPSATTKYVVTGTTSDGCSGKDSVTITVNPLPVIDIGSDVNICINNPVQIAGSVQGASTMNWSPASGLSNPSIANPVASPTTTTTYTLKATSPENCEASKSITVSVTTSIDINTSPDVTICKGSTTQLNASGAIKYQWSPAKGLSDPSIADPIASPTETTTYTVTGTNDQGCEGTKTVTVTVNPQPAISLGADAAYCIGGSYQVPGLATNATQVSWSPATGISDATIANPVASPTATTTYIVTATNGQCSAQDTITINVAPALQVNTIEDKTFCGDTTIELTTTAVTGAQYQWTPASGLSDATLASPIATLKPGMVTYKVSVTSADGCVGSDEVTLTVLDQPTIKLGADAAYCIGGSYQVPGVATNATQVSWLPATGLSDATIANPVASPAATTTYIVSATNGQCSAQDTITINVASALQVNTIEDKTFCGDTTIELTTTAVPGAQYQWTPATGLSDATIASPKATLKSGTVTYKVSVTSADGCVGSDEVTLTVLDQPTIKLGADAAYCIGGSYQVPGVATNATQVSWLPATGLSDATIANPVASPAATTTYIVSATNGQCSAQDTITINVASALQVNTIEDKTFCGDTTIELTTTAVPGAQYQWTPATGLSDATIASPIATLKSGTVTYKVSVTSADGCVGSDEVTLTVMDQPTIKLGADAAYCIGGSYQVPGVATNATQVSWLPATGLSDATIANPVASPAATTTYIVTATNGQCTAQDTITVNVASALQVNTIEDKTFCGDTTIELATTAVPGAQYQWTPTTGLSDPTIANPVANVKAGSVVNYKVLVTSNDGCVGTDNLTLTALKNPSVTAGADAAYCTGGSYQIPGVATNTTQVSWSPATGLSDATIPNPVAAPAATTTYIVTATNGQCSAKDTITINVAASIQVTPINDTSVCAGNKVPLSGTVIQGATYSWSPAAGLSSTSVHNPWASPTTTTNYILTVATPDGCVGKDSVLVTVAENPVINMVDAVTVCSGDKVTLQANSIGAKQFEWWPQQGLSDTRASKPVATVSNNITYNVRVTNASGCVSTDSVKITAAPLPVMTITKPNDIDCNNSDVQLSVTGAANYTWSPATGLNDPLSSKPIAKPGVSTQYTVKGTTLEGCTNTATVTVDVKAIPDEDFNIPSAFTPNGDGRNDCFGLRTANLTSPFQFEVYNRWGQKIFASTNTGTCWDGTFKGVPQPGDAYVWQVKVKGECGDIYKKGTVVLVR